MPPDETNQNASQQPPAAAPAAAAPPAPAAAAAPPAPQPGGDPDWLPGRLARAEESARRSLLAEFGVSDSAAIKTALAAAKAADDAKKTETERLTGRISELEPRAQRAETLETIVKERAAAEMASLNDAQRAAVAAIAGEDHAQQLKTITALRPSWGGAPPPAPAAPTGPKPITPPAPNTTAPNGQQPPPANPNVTNFVATLESLEKTNPMRAAQYRLRYANEIAAQRAQLAPKT
jgi:hypothetical protein